MATYDLSNLDVTLTANGIDQGTRAQIENYLFAHGFFAGAPGDTTTPPFAEVTNTQTPTADVEWLGGANISVTTDANLDYILDAQAGNTITIDDDGSAHNIGVSILAGTKLFLNDMGDDSISANGGGSTLDASGSSGDVTIRGSASAADTILGGTGQDILIQTAGGGYVQSNSVIGGDASQLFAEGDGGTTLQGGGGQDTLWSNAGGDTLLGGATGDNWLVAGGGDDSLKAFGSDNTLMAGLGNDTLDGSATTGSNLFYVGFGNETVTGGSGADYFDDYTNVGDAGAAGAVVKIAGGAGDTLHFENRSLTDVTTDNTAAGTRTITFSDGQQYQISDTISVEFKP